MMAFLRVRCSEWTPVVLVSRTWHAGSQDFDPCLKNSDFYCLKMAENSVVVNFNMNSKPLFPGILGEHFQIRVRPIFGAELGQKCWVTGVF